MRKLTDRKIKRLLSTFGTPEPPPGLAERIKAEIPEVLQTAGGRSPEGARGFPPRPNVLRPLWLVAASVLLMIGAGFMVAHLLAPPEDLARRIALDGVTVIKDVVVTVPERSTVAKKQPVPGAGVLDRVSALTAPPAPKAPGKGSPGRKASGVSAQVTTSRPTGSLAVTVTDGKEPLPGVTITAWRAGVRGARSTTVVSGPDGHAELHRLPPGEYSVRSELQGFEAAATTVRVAGGVEDRVGLALKPERLAEEVTVTGSLEAHAPARFAAAAANVASPAASAEPAAKGSIVVTVHDADGKLLEGATVMLAFSDRPDVGCGFRVTGRAGVATFCCVRPHTYRMCAQLRGFLPAGKDDIEVSSGRQVDVELIMVRPPTDGTEHAWTCPPPGHSGTH
jgi:hypothetical protein